MTEAQRCWTLCDLACIPFPQCPLARAPSLSCRRLRQTTSTLAPAPATVDCRLCTSAVCGLSGIGTLLPIRHLLHMQPQGQEHVSARVHLESTFHFGLGSMCRGDGLTLTMMRMLNPHHLTLNDVVQCLLIYKCYTGRPAYTCCAQAQVRIQHLGSVIRSGGLISSASDPCKPFARTVSKMAKGAAISK